MNNNSSKQVLLSVIGVAILVVAVVGVSFAFFNYSRTSENTNTVTTGTIFFTSEDEGFDNLENAFPVSATDAADANACEGTDVGCATVTVEGRTTYENGIDFSVKLADVTIPENINPIVLGALKFVVEGTPVEGITISDQTSSLTTLTDDAVLFTGHIASTETAASGTNLSSEFTIKAYFDESLIFISDTPTDPYTLEKAGDSRADKIIPTSDWNNKTISFKIKVVADQGTGA